MLEPVTQQKLMPREILPLLAQVNIRQERIVEPKVNITLKIISFLAMVTLFCILDTNARVTRVGTVARTEA